MKRLKRSFDINEARKLVESGFQLNSNDNSIINELVQKNIFLLFAFFCDRSKLRSCPPSPPPPPPKSSQLESIFAGYVPLASQNPYPILVHFGSIFGQLKTPS